MKLTILSITELEPRVHHAPYGTYLQAHVSMSEYQVELFLREIRASYGERWVLDKIKDDYTADEFKALTEEAKG